MIYRRKKSKIVNSRIIDSRGTHFKLESIVPKKRCEIHQHLSHCNNNYIFFFECSLFTRGRLLFDRACRWFENRIISALCPNSWSGHLSINAAVVAVKVFVFYSHDNIIIVIIQRPFIVLINQLLSRYTTINPGYCRIYHALFTIVCCWCETRTRRVRIVYIILYMIK